MKKILFTIQWYPSVMSANALCDQKIIKELLKHNDVDITCLTYKGTQQTRYEELDGIRVFRHRRSFWWDQRMKAHQKDCTWSRIILFLDMLILRLKQIVTAIVYPYVNIKSSLKFAIRAIQLHKREHFDVVVSEHHGLDSLLAGYALKCYDSSIKFMGILWDPISAKEAPGYLPEKYAQSRLRKLELRILNKADALVGMKSSEETVRKNIEIDPIKHFFFDIPGIIKPQHNELQRRDILKAEKINVVFSGILSLPDRDPEYLIHALNQTSFAEMLNLVFLCTGAGKNKLDILQKSFRGNISNLNYIPYKDMLSVYENADILLNFGGRNPNMVPSKIFEYMSYGKPIISMYAIDNEASKTYLDKYPLAVCIDERADQATAITQLESFLKEKVGKNVPFVDIEQYYPLNRPKVFSDLIMNL